MEALRNGDETFPDESGSPPEEMDYKSSTSGQVANADPGQESPLSDWPLDPPGRDKSSRELVTLAPDNCPVHPTLPVVDLDISESTITMFFGEDGTDITANGVSHMTLYARGAHYRVVFFGAHFNSKRFGLKGISFFREEILSQDRGDDD